MNTFNELIKYFSKLFVWFVVVQPWETGLRVRAGKHHKLLEAGAYLNIPYLDSFYVKSMRLTIEDTPMQTLSTADGKICTMKLAVSYKIMDLMKLFDSYEGVRSYVISAAMTACCDVVSKSSHNEIDIDKLSSQIYNKVASDHSDGLEIVSVKVIDFAYAKTFRLIQDQGWFPRDGDMNDKRGIQ